MDSAFCQRERTVVTSSTIILTLSPYPIGWWTFVESHCKPNAIMHSAELVVVNTERGIEVKDDYNNDREETNITIVALIALQAEGPMSLILI